MGKADETAITVLVGVDGDRVNPCIFRGSNHPNSDFTSVGNE
jgi:hypothetical protein